MPTLPEPDRIEACLLGAAVGDAIGLPYEGLSTRRAQRFARRPLRHRFVFGQGMLSDDSDHTIFVLQSLIVARGDPVRFRRALAWRLRWWLLCLPAGIGLATLRGILKLWLGLRESGVHSAGNGPSMRSAIIGACSSACPQRREELVRISTRLTHTDPKALAGALAVAEVASRLVSGAWPSKPAPVEFLDVLRSQSRDREWLNAIAELEQCLHAVEPLAAGQERFGNRQGVSGYVLHSVPFALLAWYLHYGDYRATLEAVIRAGGDTDTVGAMAGALAGCVTGTAGIPRDWREGLCDWPHSRGYLQRLARRHGDPQARVSLTFSPWLFPRAIVFTALVLLHGFRRLLPPY